MTTQPALPGLANDTSLRAYALAIYAPLYGCDRDTADIGVETMMDIYGSLAAAVTELERRAAQDVTAQRLDKAA
jgi:hypothetical protein